MYKFFILILVVASVAIIAVAPNVFATGKGLRVNLTVDSNQPAQDGYIGTFQYGDRVTKDSTHFINNGITEITLKYHKTTIENGEFEVCIAVVNAQGCGKGYDGQEKKPVYININIEGQANAPTAQAQSQASNNENNNNNENTNALSQSQSTTIYVCKENGCIAQ